jgi:hypothetical protein
MSSTEIRGSDSTNGPSVGKVDMPAAPVPAGDGALASLTSMAPYHGCALPVRDAEVTS